MNVKSFFNIKPKKNLIEATLLYFFLLITGYIFATVLIWIILLFKDMDFYTTDMLFSTIASIYIVGLSIGILKEKNRFNGILVRPLMMGLILVMTYFMGALVGVIFVSIFAMLAPKN